MLACVLRISVIGVCRAGFWYGSKNFCSENLLWCVGCCIFAVGLKEQ